MMPAAIMRNVVAELVVVIALMGSAGATLRGMKQAAKPSQNCFFGYNRANSRTMIRPVGVSQSMSETPLKGLHIPPGNC
jgi:hypothetical protein